MTLQQSTIARKDVSESKSWNTRRPANGLALVVLALLLLATAFAPIALHYSSHRGFSYGTECVAAATGEKPESKLWWNDRIWWAVLFNDAARAYHIYRLGADSSWHDTGVPVDDRPGSKSDVLWDEPNRKLYIVSHIFVDVGIPEPDAARWGRLYRYSYDPGARTYRLDPDFPVNVSRGISETMTLAKDSTGRLWTTYVENAKVMVNHSLASDTAWAVPSVLPVSERSVNLTTDDISAILAFGGDSIGAMWSNQSTMKMYFAVHRDRDPEDLWSREEIAYSSSADDHINLKADSVGRIYAAVKTSFEQSNEPLVVLLVREPGGQWSNHVFGLVRDHHTRPIVLLDEAAQRLYMFATSGGINPASEAGGSIFYKSTSTGQITFQPGLGDVFIRSPSDPLINNATSTKQNVDGATGIVVLASDRTTHRYLHSVMNLPAPMPRIH